MSKRRRTNPKPAPPPDPGPTHRQEGRRQGRILRDILILAVAFGIGVGVAELFGAANLGVAFGVGQVVFALTLVGLFTRG